MGRGELPIKGKSKRPKSSKFSLVKSFPERSTLVDSVNERSQNCGNAEILQFIWGVPKIGVPQTGWFEMKNPIKMDDLGVPPLKETPIYSEFLGVVLRVGL